MKYEDHSNINQLILAYCNAKGYSTLDERWEKDKGNHQFVNWLNKQFILFYIDQTGDDPSVLYDENWRDLKYKLWKHKNRDLFNIWLKAKYPH